MLPICIVPAFFERKCTLTPIYSNTNVSRKCDFRRFYCRAGVSPAIERLTHAGETPALHSEVQKQDGFGINSILGTLRWNLISK
jgi:hypothetical protein